jgi:dienelactone hydrolase
VLKKLLLITSLALCMTLLIVLQLKMGKAPQVVASEPVKPVQAVQAQLVSDDFVYGDPRPDAPALAYRGAYSVGVRTLQVSNTNQVDILNYDADTNPDPRYTRVLTIEVWYPAVISVSQQHIVTYTDVLGLSNDPSRPNTPFQFRGRASRDADTDGSGAPYPLVIVSHGYPGSRYMMTYLTENLASKGYVVVAIDHTESTFDNVGGFSSTLLNRSLDQLFVLDQMAQMGQDPADFLYGLVDADQTAIIGYSMGGYGALNSAGAGYNPEGSIYSWVPGGHLAVRAEGNVTYTTSLDPRLKAIVACAPWGQGPFYGTPLETWTASALANITIPSLFIVGDRDDVAQYDVGGWGVRRIFSDTVNSDRYMLVYQNALHNIAPNPPPPEAEASWPEYERYSEPAWKTTRLNNINQHFITAFLGMHLKGEDYASYLDLVTMSNDGDQSQGTYWEGFINRTAIGMEMHHESPKATTALQYLPVTMRAFGKHVR